MTVTAIASEIQKLAPSAVVELFELDLTPLGGDVQYFHAGTNSLSQNVVFNGQTYIRFPIQASGFEFSSSGQLPRPKMVVSNLFGSITQLLLVYGDFLNAKLTRRRTLAKYLDAVNFTGGVNASADPTAVFAADVYFVDRKASENPQTVEFELCSSFDVQGVELPRRQIIANICTWKYRGSECGYAGAPLFNTSDQPLTGATSAEGIAMQATYTAWLAAKTALAAAETNLTAAQQSKDTLCALQRLSTTFDGSNYVSTGFGTTGQIVVIDARFAGVSVTIGSVYRIGKLADVGILGAETFYIEKWGFNATNCANAGTALTTATTARNTAITTVATALTAFNTAAAAVPSNDPLYAFDVCGKKLSSCRARFGTNAELPYGSFPSAGLVK